MGFKERYVYFRGRRSEVVQKLREALEREPEVLLAAAFGSFVEMGEYRDIDIAVYTRKVDLRYYLDLGAKLEAALRVPVDVIPLSEAPPSLVVKALTGGLLLTEKAPGIYEALLSRAFDERLRTQIPE